MGNGRLAIGVGLGDAGIWNANPAIQQFADVLGQQKAEQAQKDQALINQMAGLKSDGIRTPDTEDYQNKYNDWKQTAIAANNLPKNSRDRLDALANAQSKYNSLGEFINASKEQKKDEHNLAQMRLLHPHIFSDSADQQLQGSFAAPMSDSKFIPSDKFGTLERYVDPEKMDAMVEKGRTQALANTNNWQTIQAPGKAADKSGSWIQQQNTIPYDGENGVAHNLLNLFDHNKDFKKSIEDRYGSIVDPSGDPAPTKALRIHQYAVDKGYDKGWNKTTEPTFKANTPPDKFYAHKEWEWNNDPSKQGNVGAPLTQQTIPISGGKNGANATAKNYVPMSLPKKNFAGVPAIDLATGRAVPALASSDDYSIVGAGDFPIIKQGATKSPQLAGTLAQSDFSEQRPEDVQHQRMVHVTKVVDGTRFDYLIPYNRLPQNIANQKDVKQALGGLNKTPVYGGQQATSGYQHTQQAKDSKGNTISLGYKNGKWYNTETNQAVE